MSQLFTVSPAAIPDSGDSSCPLDEKIGGEVDGKMFGL